MLEMNESLVKVTVNGEPREVVQGTTICSLLDSLRIRPERVAVEVNAEVIRRARHAEHRLMGGEKVEIVTFVGGG